MSTCCVIEKQLSEGQYIQNSEQVCVCVCVRQKQFKA